MPLSIDPLKFARYVARQVTNAIAKVTGDERLTRSEARRIEGPSYDNVDNFIKKTGQQSFRVGPFFGRVEDYALNHATRAAGPDGKLSADDVRRLPLDLRAEANAMLAGGDARAAELRAQELSQLAKSISLSLYGEDDNGDFVRFDRRKAKVEKLDAPTFLKAFGFKNVEKQLQSDKFSFQPMKPSDWDALLADQPDDIAKSALQRVREVMEPCDAHRVTTDDHKPYSRPVYLVARGAEGQLFAFRAVVGVMGE